MTKLLKSRPTDRSSDSSSPDQDSTFSWARNEFRSLGIGFPGKPGNDGVPSLPEDLGELSDSALMSLFNEFTQWANYIAVQVTKAEVEEDDAEAQLKVVQAKYMLSNGPSGRGDKVTVVRAEAVTDPEVVELTQEVLRRKALRKMVSTLMTNTERSTALVSRELTRRVGLAPALGRSQWTGK